MSIKRDIASGVFYIGLAKYSGIVVSLVISAILSRLLTPQEFGVVGAVTVFIAFFNILGDIGIGPAIIQKRNLTKTDIEEIFTLTICIGGVLGAVFFGLSELISRFYADPLLVPVCRILSLQIFFTCCGIVPTNLCYRDKKFKKVAFTTLMVQVLSGIAAIAYAFAGGGVFALVLQTIVSCGLLAIAFWFDSRLRIRLKITRSAIAKIFTFSAYQSLFNIINYFSRNLDKILIGRFIGLAPLGYYDKSYRMMMLPLQNITFVINPVLLPVFSDLQNDRKTVGDKYTKLISLLGYLAFPITAVLFFCGRELILLFFGGQWEAAVRPFEILSLTIGIQVINSTTGGIYQAIDATRQLFYTGCWGALFLVSSFVISIAVWGTVEAVCVGFSIALALSAAQCLYLLYRTLGVSPWLAVKALEKSFICGVVLFVLMYVVNLSLPHDMKLWESLLVKGISFGVMWMGYIWLFTSYNPVKLVKGRFPSLRS